MNTDPIRYVSIWSGWLRAAHWLIASGVLFELSSAWTLGAGNGRSRFLAGLACHRRRAA
jgi:hypothetical protein